MIRTYERNDVKTLAREELILDIYCAIFTLPSMDNDNYLKLSQVCLNVAENVILEVK